MSCVSSNGRASYWIALMMIGVACAAKAPGDAYTVPEAVPHHLIALLSAHQFEEAALLFHISPKPAGFDLKTELVFIGKLLRIVVDEFGEPVVAPSLEPISSLAGVNIDTAEPEYWESFTASDSYTSAVYPLRYSREGPGYAQFRLVLVDGKWQVGIATFVITSEDFRLDNRQQSLDAAIQHELTSP